MEGWCWGTTPESSNALENPINEFEQTHDADGRWRKFVNKTLESDYLPLYACMDYWVFLKAPNFESVYAWRLQQEQKLREKNNEAKSIMTDKQVLAFIQYYQRLTVHTLATMDDIADCVFVLDHHRNITQGTLDAKSIEE